MWRRTLRRVGTRSYFRSDQTSGLKKGFLLTAGNVKKLNERAGGDDDIEMIHDDSVDDGSTATFECGDVDSTFAEKISTCSSKALHKRRVDKGWCASLEHRRLELITPEVTSCRAEH